MINISVLTLHIFSAMTADEIRQVEAIVNEEINAGLPVLTKVMDIEDARKPERWPFW